MLTGEKCSNFHTGQAVAYFENGTFSEYMVLQLLILMKMFMDYGLSLINHV